MSLSRFLCLLAVVTCLLLPARVFAQAAQAQGKLTVTVVDPSGGVISSAQVTVIGLDEATKRDTNPSAKTSDDGVATFDHLVLGHYSIRAEFPGFDIGLLRDIRVSRGDNKHIVVLPLKGLAEQVTVGEDEQAAATNRNSTFGTALTREQIDALADDPTEMQQQLQAMAGPDAVIRVDSFEGQQLPPKAQIKAIHISRDQFSAENHYAGGLSIDIITQPGIGPLQGTVRLGFYDSAMDGRNPLIPKKGPAQNRSYGLSIGRSLIKNKSDFSLYVSGSDNYQTPNLYAATPTGHVAENLNLRTPSRNTYVSGSFNYALTKDQTFRLGFSHGNSSSDNLGVGAYDLANRAYSTSNRNLSFYTQEAGPLGRRFFINTRFQMNASTSDAHSTLEAPAIVVQDAFTSGGAQRRGGQRTRAYYLASDLDYVRGVNSWRMGVQIDASSYRSDSESNYLGTFTFASLDTYAAGQPRSYTRRIGNPLISYWNVQAGVYVQDDVKIGKSLTLSPGVRFEAQSHVPDKNNIGPRIGATWAPFKSGKTTLRASWGVFYDWLSTGTYAQTLQVDGFRQQEINIINPEYPDPGSGGSVTQTNRYLLSPQLPMVRNLRASVGVQQKLTKILTIGVSYSDARGKGLLVGQNLNAPVNGVRPDPTFANIVEAVGDGRSRLRSASIYANLFAPSGPGASGAGAPLVSWKRGLNFFVSYGIAKSENNTDGAFALPPTNDLEAQWGPAPGDTRYRGEVGIETGALKNLTVELYETTSTGTPYTILTGYDNNGDSVFNDRPAGVGRNTARTPGQWNLNGYIGYSFGFGRQQSGGMQGIRITSTGGGYTATAVTDARPKYRLTFYANLQNLTNHANYTGYSGVMTSQFFMQPTSVAGVRRVTFSMSLGF